MKYDHSGQPHFRLQHNGAQNPNRWRPDHRVITGKVLPAAGDLLAWRYDAWRATEVNPYRDVDMTGEDHAELAGYLERFKNWQGSDRIWPHHLILEHERGPLMLPDGWKPNRLHDGRRQISLSFWPLPNYSWAVYDEPYPVCSCHGHPYPCREMDIDEWSAWEAHKMDLKVQTTEPGRCAHCLEAITTLQRTVTFPEESRIVPGAPGPTFHAGRAKCWGAAEQYERTGRLVEDPFAVRVASCPGMRFVHEARDLAADERLDCTAGPACTGLHGPTGYRNDIQCWAAHWVIGDDPRDDQDLERCARPTRNCGYRSGDRVCLGTLERRPGNASFADLAWEANARKHG